MARACDSQTQSWSVCDEKRSFLDVGSCSAGPPWLAMPALQSEGASGRWRRKLSLALGPAGISRRHSNQRALLGFFAAHAIGAFSFRLWSFAVPLVLMVHASR